MDAFESLIAMLLRKEGFWTSRNLKVELTKEEKRKIGRPSSPRWEIDVVAYRGSTNEILAVECKSYLDSRGVLFRHGKFGNPKRFKLFSEDTTRRVVLQRLRKQMVKEGFCASNPKVTLCLAAGHISNSTDMDGMVAHFAKNKWKLFDEQLIVDRLKASADSGYENDVAHVVAKLILRNESQDD